MLLPLLLAAANIAPVLAKFFNAGDTTNKVAEGVATIATTLTGVSSPTEALAKITQSSELTQQFQVKINEQMMAWDAMYLADVSNARDRDVKLAQSGFRNNRANWLVIFAMFLVVGLIMVVLKMSGIPEWVQGVILFALGRAWGYLDQIYNFEFGTTKHSAAKDQTIANLSKE